MATFNPGAFASIQSKLHAVNDDKGQEVALVTDIPELNRKRAGVGVISATSRKGTDALSSDNNKLLQKLTKKTRHDRLKQTKQEGELSSSSSSSCCSDSEDEEEGRTTAISKSAISTNTKNKTYAKISSKQAPSTLATTKSTHGEKDPRQQVNDTAAGGSEEQQQQLVVKEEEVADQKKHRKPKKRSKQKNIRKDNRVTKDKPPHLIVGSENYTGREITPETRAKLGMPEPKKGKSNNFKRPYNQMLDNVAVQIEDDPTLGVLAVENHPIKCNEVNDSPKKPPAKKKRKKQKYKNLM